jgi:hypothetical protein
MNKHELVLLSILLILTSCEEVIDIDLNKSHPAFVVEAIICKDSVSIVRLTQTSNYFSLEELLVIDNAAIMVKSGENSSEDLSYLGNGYYIGNSITGTEDTNYEIEIIWDGSIYNGKSYMPAKTEIFSVEAIETPSRPGDKSEKVFSINCKFGDNTEADEFYMIRFIQNGETLKDMYHLVPDYFAVNDTITYINWINSFENGDEVEIQVFSIDKSVFDYFMQLNEAIGGGMNMSSTPYNPKSNVSNGALGYFAAWAYDFRIIMIDK